MNLDKNLNVLEATKEVINNSGISRLKLSIDLGIEKTTFDNKMKASSDSKFFIEEVLEITEATDDNRILKAMCAERGMITFDPIETMPNGGDVLHETLMSILSISTGTGNLSDLIHRAADDMKLDSKEAQDISKTTASLREVLRKMEVMLENHVE